MKKVKLSIVITGTLINIWFSYWLFQYAINVKGDSFEGTILATTFFFIMVQFLFVWIAYGMDIIKRI